MKLSEGIWVALGGTVGAVLRAIFSDAFDGIFPWGILFANVAGAGLLALGYTLKDRWAPQVWHFHGAGFCGGFTTVSTFSEQLVGLASNGRLGLAVSYLLLSLMAALPLVAAVLWWEAGKLTEKPRP